MDIGDKIRQLREEKGMTLEELGNKVGVGKSTVRKWETGMIENMRRDKIKKVADALNVTPDYLMGWSEQPHEFLVDGLRVEVPTLPQGDREEALREKAKMLYESYHNASPEVQKAVDLLLKADKQS